MMRIALYDPYLDDLGGGEKYMMSIALCLSEGNEVSVFWDNADDLKRLEKRFSFDLKTITLVKNIFSPSFSALERLKVSRKYDIILILSDGSIPVTLSKKLFLHIQQPLHNIDKSSLKEKLKLSRISGIFFNSQYTKSFNNALFPNNKKAVIYPPVQSFYKKIKKESIILHVGRFRPMNMNNVDYKKQQVMIKTFKEMVDKGFTNWKFVIATSTADITDKRFVDMLHSTKGYPIEILVNKSNQELWEVYNKAKLYWHASGYGEDLSLHPEYAEHFGISTVEAMSAGCVPVVINVGGQTEIITDGINGFLWKDLEELKKRTIQLANDAQLLESLSEKARVRAEDFSYDEFCKKIRALITV